MTYTTAPPLEIPPNPAVLPALLGVLRKHPRHRSALRVSSVLWVGLAGLALSILLGAFLDGWRWAALCLASTIAAAFLIDAWARRSHQNLRAERLADGLVLHTGVWWQRDVFVPTVRVQHIEVNQGPLDRRWGMATLIVHTAGTQLNAIHVPALYREDAVTLRDSLLERHGHDAV
jgi:hypothetical protein